jgi:hypothetical protein
MVGSGSGAGAVDGGDERACDGSCVGGRGRGWRTGSGGAANGKS